MDHWFDNTSSMQSDLLYVTYHHENLRKMKKIEQTSGGS